MRAQVPKNLCSRLAHCHVTIYESPCS